MIVNVKNVPDLSQLPKVATPKSAAYDVVAVADPEIVGEKDGEHWNRIDYIQYHTAVFAAPQTDNYGKDYHILIHPRSSVSKYNLVLCNGIGLIDTDYRGELLVRYKYIWQPEDLLWGGNPAGDNLTIHKRIWGIVNMDRIYKKGERVAQLVVEPTTEAEWVRVENLDETTRGTGGFGSTTIPVGKTANTLKISKNTTDEFVKRLQPLPGIKPASPQEHERNYETHVNLVEQWKKQGGVAGTPANYETLVREREKKI